VLDGNTLYGGTGSGGSNGCCGGTIFKLNTNGSDYSILRHFGAPGTYEGAPNGDLTLSGDALYCTSGDGGSNYFGTAFRIKTDGTEFTILHHFVSNPGNSRPWNGVTLVGDTLYGTTANVSVPDTGTVFSLKTDGSDFSTIKAFSGYANVNYQTNIDGASPQARPVASGNALYSAASKGGLYDYGNGLIYKITLPVPLKILPNDASFGVQSNLFGFNVTGNSNQTIVIEACTNLATFDWVALQTNILGAGPLYFNDPDWTNHSGRYYRVRSP
jgi:uncharacterized repeat protein (TIGR03803 family)